MMSRIDHIALVSLFERARLNTELDSKAQAHLESCHICRGRLNWMQVSMVKWWTVKERYRFELRFDGYNWPLEQPQYSNPNASYNLNSLGTFGRITGVQGSFSGAGAGRPNMWLIGRFEF